MSKQKSVQIKNKRPKPPIYAMEECLSCNQKTTRLFQAGDYIYGAGKECSLCKSPKTMIKSIYTEPVKASKST